MLINYKGKQREIDEEKLEEMIDIADKNYKTFEEWLSANTDKIEKMKDVAISCIGEYSLEYGADEDLFTRELRQFLFLAYEAGKKGNPKNE